MARVTGTASRTSGGPRYDTPRSVASGQTRETRLEVDVTLVRGAVEHAIARTRDSLHRHDLAAALLADPVNIRYVTGTSTMPVWTLHMIDRYMLVPAEGQPVLWEYASAPADLVSPYPHLETRTATSWSAFGSGDRAHDRAARFAAEVARVLQEWAIRDARIGVDRLDTYGFLALQEAGLHLRPAQLAMEEARARKGAAEIELIRRSVSACDEAVTHLHHVLRPGMTENEAWGEFTGRAFALGGEYVEARLLSSGPRTNPWFREAGDRRIRSGDLVSFDTDLIGPAGYLADVSRTYLVGSTKPTARQLRLYADAETFLSEIIGELRPGAAFDDVGQKLGRRLPPAYRAQRYPFIAHGSGLSDEYPVIRFEDHHAGEIEAGMVFSVEAYMGAEGDDEGLKLEEQILVTDEGVEQLSRAPHDDQLSGA
ncbi:M24 family metallopeptidase [Blastococcus saxobsidens]|uniref:Proline dipeptidase n=1 Tax=Blastococcus saxobsidens (strain DD2) TaxID=1146883 RepID=H6RMC8_BLASD|nr:Xaa-Pro peptidase family protein [Blastococcus saxobsidens]CCG02564.1 Proline dipeptidase [Blastococcus saxobsidens DD2]